MKCPRCKTDHTTLHNGKFVYENMNTCLLCGFIIESSDSEKFQKRCIEMIMRNITDFKRTKDVMYVYKANTYLQALLEEVHNKNE